MNQFKVDGKSREQEQELPCFNSNKGIATIHIRHRTKEAL